MFGSRIADILTGRSLGRQHKPDDQQRSPAGGFSGLGNRRGAVVGDPTTGAILAAASSPSYDPSTLSSHNTGPSNSHGRPFSTTRISRC
jgi:peptidoglycan glycosyltransferase